MKESDVVEITYSPPQKFRFNVHIADQLLKSGFASMVNMISSTTRKVIVKLYAGRETKP